jgi:hypothetical protein
MGGCRRLKIAQALGRALDEASDDERRKLAIRSLSEVGNAWAWRTPGPKQKSDEGAVREAAARALLRAYVRFDGELRQAASNALMVVDSPLTPSLIGAERSANPGARLALAELSLRFENNPTR